MPAKTIGLTSSNPKIASFEGLFVDVIVSPTFTSLAFLIPEIIYPTSPVDNVFFGS